jgi:hypothetical protein
MGSYKQHSDEFKRDVMVTEGTCRLPAPPQFAT